MRLIAALAFLVISAPAVAAEAPAVDSSLPVEISAKHSLEWNRKEKTYVAREDAVAKQGNFSVSSNTLTAHYDDAKGATDITKLVASGNVIIQSPPYTAHGEEATYDVPGNSAILTGGNLSIETATEKLTARDRVEFFGLENRLTAVGNAVAVRGTDRMQADTMDAFFKKGADNKLALQKITANGNVSIRTPRETVTGNKGVYDVTAGKAVLTGIIRIKQGENWLEGTRAVVDLKTGISQLFAEGNAATEGRVKGMFFPKKKPQ